MRIGRPSLRQAPMWRDVHSCLIALKWGTLGGHPQHCAHLFPCLNLDVDVASHPLGSSSQGPLEELLSAGTILRIISSFQCYVCHCNSSCGPTGDDLSLSSFFPTARSILCSRSLSSCISIMSSLLAHRTAFQSPIFQLTLEHSNLMGSHCQLPFLKLLLPNLHLILLQFDTVPSLQQTIPFFILLLCFFCFFLLCYHCLPPFVPPQITDRLHAIVQPLELELQLEMCPVAMATTALST